MFKLLIECWKVFDNIDNMTVFPLCLWLGYGSAILVLSAELGW
jgi:hypothetical protein